MNNYYPWLTLNLKCNMKTRFGYRCVLKKVQIKLVLNKGNCELLILYF